MDEFTVRRDLVSLLRAYLSGAVDLDRLLAWEAGLSLAPDLVGDVRTSLDELALVGEEVRDGIRSEQELRGLAIAILVRETVRLASAVTSTASPAEPIWRTFDTRAPETIEPEIIFSGT